MQTTIIHVPSKSSNKILLVASLGPRLKKELAWFSGGNLLNASAAKSTQANKARAKALRWGFLAQCQYTGADPGARWSQAFPIRVRFTSLLKPPVAQKKKKFEGLGV